MGSRRLGRRVRLGITLTVLATALVVVLVGVRALLGSPEPAAPTVSSAEPAYPPLPQASPGQPVVLAIAGDSNAEGSAGRVLSAGLGAMSEPLSSADVALVNLETALADNRTGLVRQPKQFAFLAPSRYLDMLAAAGVDAVSVANNHGLDYGRDGLTRTLAARSATRPALIGVGEDDQAAWRAWQTRTATRRVLVFAATDVLDDGFDWAAAPGRSGMAVVKTEQQLDRLRQAVRKARVDGPEDVVVVFLHAGVERVTCPTDRQRRLATVLANDGVDLVAMSHAHVMQPATVIGRTAVLYGLGNFVFASHRPQTARTGVVTVRVGGSGAPELQLHPATIRSGIPVPDAPASAAAAVDRWRALAAQCPEPGAGTPGPSSAGSPGAPGSAG